jgi:hypothetical protein
MIVMKPQLARCAPVDWYSVTADRKPWPKAMIGYGPALASRGAPTAVVVPG